MILFSAVILRTSYLVLRIFFAFILASAPFVYRIRLFEIDELFLQIIGTVLSVNFFKDICDRKLETCTSPPS
jgi:hypothetical protein